MSRKRAFASLALFALGIWTALPTGATKLCYLGYYAHCSFTPISTIICIVAAIIVASWGGSKK